MRLAIFSELYAPSIGGQEAFFRGLSRALIARGHQIDVYCIAHEAGLPAREEIDGVTVHRCPVDPHYKAPRFKALKRNWGTIWSFARFTAKVARRREHDFYLLNQWPFLHAWTLPVSVRSRSLLHWCEIRHSGPFRFFQAKLPKYVGLNAAISDAVGTQIHDASGREVFTLPSGLDLTRSEYRPHGERRDIVSFGRIMAHKNVPLAVDAFEHLRAGGYTGRLKIAGDGPDIAALRARVAASPVADAIDMLGFIDDDEKFRLLAGCEAMVIPSKREGFPHVISEAMCCGLPVVTADFPENGSKDMVSLYRIGAVTEPNGEAFAAGIRRVLDGWQGFSDNGRKAAATLDWASIARHLEDRMVAAVKNSSR